MLLTEARPDLASQWHPTLNEEGVDKITTGLRKQAWWLCPKDKRHEWPATVKGRVNNSSKSSGCPVCAGNLIIIGVNDLATLRPDIAAQWDDSKDGLTPKEVTVGSKKTLWWKCSKGHSWPATVMTRTSTGHNCTICANSLIVPGINDLVTTHPDIAAQWHPTKNGDALPTQYNSGSGKKFWWKRIDCGHERESRIVEKVKNSKCLVCAGHKEKTKFPQQKNLVDIENWTIENIDSRNVCYKDEKGFHWKCKLGHTWTRPLNQSETNAICHYCSGRNALVGFNDLYTTHPELAKEIDPDLNDGKSGYDFTASNTKVINWTGTLCGHIWDNAIERRAKRGEGCSYCSGKRVLVGFNDLATKNPELAAQWHPTLNGDLKPTDMTAGSDITATWLCNTCEKVWPAHISGRKRGRGCPRCSRLISSGEEEVYQWLLSLGVTVIKGSKSIIAPYEIDLYLPEYNFAIEYNGMYWHSEDNGKGFSYHKNKTDKCLSQGVTLFHLWEDDWNYRKEIIKRMIKHRLNMSDEKRVYARKLTITKVDFATAKVFMEDNHIQGVTNGSAYVAGIYEGKVVAMMITKKSGNILSLERYATSSHVIGGMSKLLKYTLQEPEFCDVTKVITFADLSISNGNSYDVLGFTKDKILPPDYSYVVNNQRVHKFGYRLKRFKNDPDLLYQDGMTEKELAKLNKLRRIWDSGKIRYTLDVER